MGLFGAWPAHLEMLVPPTRSQGARAAHRHFNRLRAVQDVASFLAANGVTAEFLDDTLLSVYKDGTFKIG